ncbi:metallophosphoesterase [Effusibacillus pohliae]|uniref:metallophosphoesterase n=1 Tax=Effusibacillus pohliae TaxID=232270 RepID=UPI000365E271|nr:YfcE family phosphodiesterase [Effusibacillus pohliae]
MKICVISDSHGRTDRIDQILRRHLEIDLLLHAGDHADDVADRRDVRCKAVCGNCDVAGTAPDEQLLDLAGLRVLLTHGHLYKVKQTLLPLSYRAKETNAQLVIFGHSHVPVIVEEEGIVFLNPGSLSYPRGVVSVPTYAIVRIHSLDAGQNVAIRLYSVNGDEFPEFRYEHTFANC